DATPTGATSTSVIMAHAVKDTRLVRGTAGSSHGALLLSMLRTAATHALGQAQQFGITARPAAVGQDGSAWGTRSSSAGLRSTTPRDAVQCGPSTASTSTCRRVACSAS